MRIFNTDKGWKHIVTSDGRGYYAYLPALLIDHDPSFSKVVAREKKLLGMPHYQPGYLVNYNGKTLNKYFAGEALLLFPFFLLGLVFSLLFGTEINGYSFFFQGFTGLGTLFYLVWGLWYLKKILEWLKVRQQVIGLTLFAIVFGTNLFYYSLWQPTMSHVFSFFIINGFLWMTVRAINGWNWKRSGLMGIFLGLTFLVRPTNIVVIFMVPFLAGGWSEFLTFLRITVRDRVAFLFRLLMFLAIVSVQPLIWYFQTGSLFVWPYSGEGFRFGSPEIINVLFSYRKGLFVYTPLIFIAWTGLLYLIFINRFRFIVMICFLIVSTYIIASWWNWYYGDGFGLRAFIDYYGIYAILLAFILNKINSRFLYAVSAFLILLPVIINGIQTWQYTNKVIQPNSMNREKYQYIFLRTDSAVINSLGGNREMADYNIDLENPAAIYFNDFEREDSAWNALSVVSSGSSFSGRKSGYMDSVHPFSPGLVLDLSKSKIPTGRYFLEGKLMAWDSLIQASNHALLVISMDSINPEENYWQGFLLNDIPDQEVKFWRKVEFSLMLPEIKNPNGVLKVYVWNTGKKPMLIDDFGIRIYGVKK